MRWWCGLVGVAAVGFAGMTHPPAVRADDPVSMTPDASEPPLYAVARLDHDLGPADARGAKPVDVPPAVASVIHTVAHSSYARYVTDMAVACRTDACVSGPLPMRSLYGPIVRIPAPRGRFLYVYRQDAEIGYSWYVPILADPKTGAVTQVPPRIYGKWTDAFEELTPGKGHLVRKPIVAFDDVDQDGAPELVIQERAHNAPAYDAALFHYFHVGDDLSLRRVLVVETRLVDALEERHGARRRSPDLVTRTVEKTGRGTVRLRVRLESPDGQHAPREVGTLTLRSATPGTPFTIAERMVRLAEYEPVLVTGSIRPEGDPDDNTFLGTGEYPRY